MIVRVEPYQATMDAIQQRLTEMGKEKNTNAVMKKAINEVAASGKELLYTGVKESYTIRARAFKKADITKKAMTAKRGASLTVKGVTPGLRKAYQTRKNGKKKGAQGMVIKDSAMKELKISAGGKTYKAFVATMKNQKKKTGETVEHQGIFQRVPGKYMKNNPATPESKGREAIKEIMSMSRAKAAEMVFEQRTYAELQEEMSYRLLKQMNAVIGGIK